MCKTSGGKVKAPLEMETLGLFWGWAQPSTQHVQDRECLQSFWDNSEAGLVKKLLCQQAKGPLLNLKGINRAPQLPAINAKCCDKDR